MISALESVARQLARAYAVWLPVAGLFVFSIGLVSCTIQQVAHYRDPKTGIIVEECLRDPMGWRGIFADVDQANHYADCKTRAEERGLERVR